MTFTGISLILLVMFDFTPLSPIIRSVSELTQYLRQLLEADEVLQDVWIRGEISNFSRPRSGHLYFTLKDSQASIRCVVWKGPAMRLRFEPQDGMLVEAHGSMSMYEASGQVQLYIDSMRPAGEGALYLEFLRLRDKLEAAGLFDAEHKRPIPSLPKVIGVVTSATGAALQDILNTLSRRMPLVQVILAPTAVQGVDAPEGIVKALTSLNEQANPDVIIIGRGGGSIEDLWAFNSEEVANAIYNSEAPVISGVGHETDFTIADFVADLRAPTPTAAAEMASPITIGELTSEMGMLSETLSDLVKACLSISRQDLMVLTEQMKRLSPQAQIYMQRQRLDEIFLRYERTAQTMLKSHKLELESLSQRLANLNPSNVLKRGYAIVTHYPDGPVINHVEQVGKGDKVQIRVQDGSIMAEVETSIQASKHENK